MSVKLTEVAVNTTAATLWDHLSVSVDKASISLVMDYNAMVILLFHVSVAILLTE